MAPSDVGALGQGCLTGSGARWLIPVPDRQDLVLSLWFRDDKIWMTGGSWQGKDEKRIYSPGGPTMADYPRSLIVFQRRLPDAAALGGRSHATPVNGISASAPTRPPGCCAPSSGSPGSIRGATPGPAGSRSTRPRSITAIANRVRPRGLARSPKGKLLIAGALRDRGQGPRPPAPGPHHQRLGVQPARASSPPTSPPRAPPGPMAGQLIPRSVDNDHQPQVVGLRKAHEALPCQLQDGDRTGTTGIALGPISPRGAKGQRLPAIWDSGGVPHRAAALFALRAEWARRTDVPYEMGPYQGRLRITLRLRGSLAGRPCSRDRRARRPAPP